MRSVSGVFVVLVAALATFYFVFWLPLWFLLPIGRWPAVRITGGLLCAIAVARYVWKHRPSGVRARGGGRWCLLVDRVEKT